jgi:hypothetical protein
MAPTCSTRTRVVSPSSYSSGRNDAGLALSDVGDQDYRARQQLVGLDNNSVPPGALLVARPPRRAEFVNVTPQHACSP